MRWITLFVCLICPIAQATIYITVTGANVRKAKLALGHVHPLPDNSSPDSRMASDLRDQIQSDLEFTNLFEFVNESLFAVLDQPKDLYNVRFEEWGLTGSSFLLKLGYKVQSGKLILEAILYDVSGQKKIFGTRYQYPVIQYPRLVHALAEDVLKELTGEKGLFISRILMVCREKRGKRDFKEIYISDPDGRNFTQVTVDKTLSLSPAWAPDGRHVSYTQYETMKVGGVMQRTTVLKKHNLLTGERKVISAREGMNSGSAWSPEGQKIAATLSFSGRPEIYLLNSSGLGEPEPVSRVIQWRRISGEGFQPNYSSLLFEVEPSWSPDGKKLVFSSARTGHPMIYIVELATKTANQLTFAGVYNATPAWSPKGDKIIFAAQRNGEGNFDLFLIDPDGTNLVRITNGDAAGGKKFNNESPSWAPTGRHLAFAGNEGGTYGVYVMAMDGSVKRKISPPEKECTTPAWGPPE